LDLACHLRGNSAIAYTTLNAGRATGIGWVHWKGFVLMGVGVLYFVFGLVLTRISR
jgi:hypothetical protein